MRHVLLQPSPGQAFASQHQLVQEKVRPAHVVRIPPLLSAPAKAEGFVEAVCRGVAGQGIQPHSPFFCGPAARDDLLHGLVADPLPLTIWGDAEQMHHGNLVIRKREGPLRIVIVFLLGRHSDRGNKTAVLLAQIQDAPFDVRPKHGVRGMLAVYPAGTGVHVRCAGDGVPIEAGGSLKILFSCLNQLHVVAASSNPGFLRSVN